MLSQVREQTTCSRFLSADNQAKIIYLHGFFVWPLLYESKSKSKNQKIKKSKNQKIKS